MDEDDKTKVPMSDELLDHVRRYNYDEQGKGFWRESNDSMWIIAYSMILLGVLAIVVIVLLIVKGGH